MMGTRGQGDKGKLKTSHSPLATYHSPLATPTSSLAIILYPQAEVKTQENQPP
ncbi:MAG TPA: hypothetical protein V6D09_12740 [Leptolyngbyaceae cyanobacterium]